MTEVTQKTATDLVCVMLDVHIWSGRRHLKREDLLKANPAFNKIPEKDLVNLGSVKIYDHQDLKKFNSLKGKAERILARHGLPFLGAMGIPDDKFAMVHATLAELQKEFGEYAATLIAAYDDRVAAWKVKQTVDNPDFAHLLTDMPTATHVAGRISFAFHPYRIAAPASQDNPVLNERYDNQVKGLKGELMSEVAAEANTLMSDYLMAKEGESGAVKRRDYITPKTLGPLKRAATKLRTFSFLDPSIEPLANHIDDVVKTLPVERIDGADLIKVWSLARMLSSPADAARIAEQVYRGDSVDELVSIVQADAVKLVSEAPVAEQASLSFTVPVEQKITVQQVASEPLALMHRPIRDLGSDLSSLL